MSSATIFLFFRPPGRRRGRSARPALDDCGLADAGLADEHRVVLGAARQDLDDAADFVTGAGSSLPLRASSVQIAAVAFERLIGPSDSRSSPAAIRGRGQRLQDRVPRDVVLLSTARWGASARRRSSEQVLGADVLVLHPRRFVLGGGGQLVQPRRQVGLAPPRGRQLRDQIAPRARSAPDRRSSCAAALGTMPSRCSASASDRCSGSSCGLLC